MTSTVVSLFDAVFPLVAHLLPLAIAVQIVAILGSNDSPVWIAKEFLGALAAAVAVVPFAVALYPDTLPVWFPTDPLWLWTLRVCAERATLALALGFVVTAYGIEHWGWHGADEPGWRRLPFDGAR